MPVTPAPMGDLRPPRQCREEAGPDLILSGGVPPSVWIEPATDEDFRTGCRELAGDSQAEFEADSGGGRPGPPKTPEHRIEMMHDLVERTGYYLRLLRQA